MHMSTDLAAPELFTENEVAKMLRVSVACIRRWRLERRGPRYIKLGMLVRYRAGDLDEWLDSRPVGGGEKPLLD